ncbi:MAG: hypothetical protein JNM89_00765 [Hyphomicrobiaceae bacterium]|nr:hypothetical protein [Hyphomicrobiaceae bacterium]
MTSKLAIVSGATLLVLAGTLVPGQVRAEAVALSACSSTVKAGTVLADSVTIEVAAGSRCRLMLPSGRTQELTGPVKTKVAELTKGEARNEGLWNDVVNVLSRQKRADESVIGAVRSVAPKARGSDAGAPAPAAAPAPSLRLSFSWRQVPIDTGGDVCIEKGAKLELMRARPGKPMSIAIVNRQTNNRGEASFDVGSATAPWPEDVGTDVGLYAIALADGTNRTLRLRPISPLPEPDDTLRVLHSQRCLVQIEAWLAGYSTALR